MLCVRGKVTNRKKKVIEKFSSGDSFVDFINKLLTKKKKKLYEIEF